MLGMQRSESRVYVCMYVDQLWRRPAGQSQSRLSFACRFQLTKVMRRSATWIEEREQEREIDRDEGFAAVSCMFRDNAWLLAVDNDA